MKPFLVLFGAASIVTGSYFGSTQLGLRSEGALDVQVELPRKPRCEPVGQNLYTQDGTKLLVTSVTRDRTSMGTKHVIHASVRGTHRYALQLFPTRMIHTFSMDRQAIERTLREAAGEARGEFVATDRQWHVVN